MKREPNSPVSQKAVDGTVMFTNTRMSNQYQAMGERSCQPIITNVDAVELKPPPSHMAFGVHDSMTDSLKRLHDEIDMADSAAPGMVDRGLFENLQDKIDEDAAVREVCGLMIPPICVSGSPVHHRSSRRCSTSLIVKVNEACYDILSNPLMTPTQGEQACRYSPKHTPSQ